MKRLRNFGQLFTASALSLVLGGCSIVPYPIGGIFSSVNHPGVYNPGQTTNPGQATVYGESCAVTVLGIFAIGDWSVDAALREAGAEGKTLKNVAIDHPTMNILGIYGKYCTTISAEIVE